MAGSSAPTSRDWAWRCSCRRYRLHPVAWHVFPRSWLLLLIAGAALIQIVLQFRLFLHIDLSRSKRDDLQLILFSTLIAVLMVSGTIWIFFNQQMRMM